MVTQTFSTKWKASKARAKQRKYSYNAPLHLRRHFLSAPLAKDLREKSGTRNMPVKKGDKVKIMRGQFKGHVGKVDKTDVARTKVYVAGAELQRRDGTKALYPLHPSNVMILELQKGDKKRDASLDRKKNKGKAQAQPKAAPKQAAQPAKKEEKKAEKKD